MKPVPASVLSSITMQSLISLSFVDVNALIIMLIGQIMSYPMCGPPIPSPAVPLKKIRVAVAQNETARISINRAVRSDVTEIGKREKTRDIRVVHKIVIAEPVDLKGIYIPEFRVTDNRLSLQRALNLVSKRPALPRHRRFMIHGLEDLCGLSERSHRKEVGRHKELKDSRVVGGPEGRSYEPARLHRISQAVAALGVVRTVGHARKYV